MAEQLRHAGPRCVVVKGGHLTESADDVVAGPDGVTVLPGTRVATANDHGTGCTLSAAVAAGLASGSSVPEAMADGQGLRRPGLGRRRGVAARGRARPARPFRVVAGAVG